jgi:hypothetical protein
MQNPKCGDKSSRMKHTILIFGLVLGSAVIVGCGKEESSKASSVSYSYDFNQNGCPTGQHTFDSKSAYCAGLKNEDLNNGCAYSTRYQTYKAECGSDW